MTRWLKLLSCLVVVCGLALAAPVAALAGGPSAGDQQYVDPLKAGSHHSSSSSSSSSSSTSAPTSVSSTSSTSAPTSSGTTSPTATSSAAGTASSSATAAGDPKGTLPFTGMNIWSGAAVGVFLLGCGAYLRRLARHT